MMLNPALAYRDMVLYKVSSKSPIGPYIGVIILEAPILIYRGPIAGLFLSQIRDPSCRSISIFITLIFKYFILYMLLFICYFSEILQVIKVT